MQISCVRVWYHTLLFVFAFTPHDMKWTRGLLTSNVVVAAICCRCCHCATRHFNIVCLHSIPHCLSSLSCDAGVTQDMKWERSWMPDGREWSGTDHLCLAASPGKPLKRRSSLQPRCFAVWFLKGLTSLFVPPALKLLIKKSMAFVMAGLFGGSSWTHVLAPDVFFEGWNGNAVPWCICTRQMLTLNQNDMLHVGAIAFVNMMYCNDVKLRGEVAPRRIQYWLVCRCSCSPKKHELIRAPQGARAYPWILSKYFPCVRPSVRPCVHASVRPCVRPPTDRHRVCILCVKQPFFVVF